MAKKNARRNRQSDRRIWISSIRKDPPDFRKLGRALIAVAMMQAEAEAVAEAEHAKKRQAKDEAGGDEPEEKQS